MYHRTLVASSDSASVLAPVSFRFLRPAILAKFCVSLVTRSFLFFLGAFLYSALDSPDRTVPSRQLYRYQYGLCVLARVDNVPAWWELSFTSWLMEQQVLTIILGLITGECLPFATVPPLVPAHGS